MKFNFPEKQFLMFLLQKEKDNFLTVRKFNRTKKEAEETVCDNLLKKIMYEA